MDNETIRKEIKRIGSMRIVSDQIGIERTTLYNKIRGDCQWRIEELLALAKVCGWTKNQFLNIIGFEEKED